MTEPMENEMNILACADACRTIAAVAGDDVLVITMSTMKTLPGIAPQANFVSCVPLMGGAASIGLGIAVARPDVRVWVLDGDASLLMELGSLVTVAEARPANLVHLLFDNRVQYGGTANMALPGGGEVDFNAMALAAGYAHAAVVETADQLEPMLRDVASRQGPVFVRIRVAPDPGYYNATTPQREIPDNQITRMGDEGRRVRQRLAGRPSSASKELT